MQSWIQRVARPVECFLGAVFLVSALLKAEDAINFVRAIAAYGVITNKSLLPVVAYCSLSLELLLGFALFWGIRRRWITYALLEGLLLFFTGLILFAWLFHGLKECGCTGRIKTPPEIAVPKNLVLMALGAVAWLGQRPSTVWGRGTLMKAAVSVALTAGVLGYAYAAPGKTLPPTPFTPFVFDTQDGQHFDLGHGEYLVAMLSMSCEHCMGEVPAMNDLLPAPDIPRMVALCLEESPGEMAEFQATTNPMFPMHSIGNDTALFFSLTGITPPRFYFVRDGRAVTFWDDHLPGHDELVAAAQAK